MFSSKNKLFQVGFISERDTCQSIISKEKQFYLCVEPKQPFQVRMITVNESDEVFGAKLYIDGSEIHGAKTFKYVGHFFGLKEGGGVYKEFVFDEPKSLEEYNQENSNHMDVKNEEREARNLYPVGHIRIEFYSTKRVRVKKEIKQISNNRARYSQSYRSENKKFFLKSMSVKCGDTFIQPNSHFYNEKLKNLRGEEMIDNYIDYSDQIDEINVNYADFLALQIMGVVKFQLNYLGFYQKHRSSQLNAENRDSQSFQRRRSPKDYYLHSKQQGSSV